MSDDSVNPQYCFLHFTVVIWCTSVGTYNTGTTALCGGGSLRDGCVLKGWISSSTTNQLS